MREGLRRRDRGLSPWRWLAPGPLVQKGPKKNTENQNEPLRELSCRLIIHVCSQLPSCMLAECGSSITLGPLDKLISTKSAISAQMVSWFDKPQPSSHLQPPGGLSCISSPSVPYTWLVHMALNYSKDKPLAPGVELPTISCLALVALHLCSAIVAPGRARLLQIAQPPVRMTDRRGYHMPGKPVSSVDGCWCHEFIKPPSESTFCYNVHITKGGVKRWWHLSPTSGH